MSYQTNTSQFRGNPSNVQGKSRTGSKQNISYSNTIEQQYDKINEMENIDKAGFDPEIEDEEDEDDFEEQFDQREFSLSNFAQTGNRIKKVVISEYQIIILTDANEIWRLRFEQEELFFSLQIPQMPKDSVSKVMSGLKKLVGQSKKQVTEHVKKMFVDKKGYHAILSCNNGDNFYLNLNDDKIRPLLKIRGAVIKSVAFQQDTLQDKTKEILLGTDSGQIIKWSLNIDEGIQHLEDQEPEIQVDLRNSISHLQIVTLKQEKGVQFVIIASTHESIHCFIGSSANLFRKYEQDHKKLEDATVPMILSQDNNKALMDICYSKKDSRPLGFIWTNGNCLNYYNFPGKLQLVDHKMIKQSQHFCYANKTDPAKPSIMMYGETPRAIGLSQFHYYILHSDGMTIMSRVTEKVVQYYDLTYMAGCIGMQYTESNSTYWIYSGTNVCKIEITNEHKDVWKLYYNKQMYKEAFNVCKDYYNKNQQFVAQTYAHELFEQQRYEEAGRYYFEAQLPFEWVFLKFVTNVKTTKSGMRAGSEGLEIFLVLWLKKINLDNDKTKTHLKHILISWIVELKVYKLNFLNKSINNYNNKRKSDVANFTKKFQEILKDLKEAEKKMHIDFGNFLNSQVMNKEESLILTVQQILQSHGRIDICVEFAEKKDSYEMMVQHYINEQDFAKSLEYVSLLQKNPLKFQEVLLKNIHIFMQYETNQTYKLIEQSKLIKTRAQDFDYSKLIGGLMNIQPQFRNKDGVSFVKNLLRKMDSNSPFFLTLNNIQIFFLTEPLDNEELVKHLKKQLKFYIKEKVLKFDINFVLRLLKKNKGTEEAQIYIYLMMGLDQEALNVALEYDFIDLAKEKVDIIQNIELKKKLQIQIAIHLLNKGDQNVERVIKMTKDFDENSEVQIEDLLQLLKTIKIEHFKQPICDNLRNYSEEAKNLKESLDYYTMQVDDLQNEQRMIVNRTLELDSQKKCQICQKNLYVDEFYVFPCLHGYHKECLYQKMLKLLTDQDSFNAAQYYYSQIQSLLQKVKKHKDKYFSQLRDKYFNSKDKKSKQNNNPMNTDLNIYDQRKMFNYLELNLMSGNVDESGKFMGLQEEELYEFKMSKSGLDQIIAKQCIQCSSYIIDQIQQELVDDEEQKKSWSLD